VSVNWNRNQPHDQTRVVQPLSSSPIVFFYRLLSQESMTPIAMYCEERVGTSLSSHGLMLAFSRSPHFLKPFRRSEVSGHGYYSIWIKLFIWSLPVHPVHKMRKLVLPGRRGGNSGNGRNQRIPFIYGYLRLCCLGISDLRKTVRVQFPPSPADKLL
jgi:hypothetical protein